jgi:hypothetical protein
MPRAKKVVGSSHVASMVSRVEKSGCELADGSREFTFDAWEGQPITLTPQQVEFARRERLIDLPGQSPSRRTILHIQSCCAGRMVAA